VGRSTEKPAASSDVPVLAEVGDQPVAADPCLRADRVEDRGFEHQHVRAVDLEDPRRRG
jgi:hypothetical protein